MFNVLLVEEDMNYGKKLINKLAIKNKDFRLCGIVNNKKEIMYFLNNLEIDIILINLSFDDWKECIEMIKTEKYRNSVIIILNKKSEINNINKILKHYEFNYIIKSDNLNNDIENINSFLISKAITHISTKRKIEKKHIKEKIKKELNYLGYNLEYLGSKYCLRQSI